MLCGCIVFICYVKNFTEGAGLTAFVDFTRAQHNPPGQSLALALAFRRFRMPPKAKSRSLPKDKNSLLHPPDDRNPPPNPLLARGDEIFAIS